MNRYMVDIETFSLLPNAYVLSIGVTRFDVEMGILEELYVELDGSMQVKSNRDINPSTIRWWLRQAAAAPESALFPNAIADDLAFAKFTNFFSGMTQVDQLWAQGPQMDIVVLESLSRDLGIEVPWSYRGVRDSRTLLCTAEELGIDINHKVDAMQFTSHNALDDARVQSLRVINALRGMGLSPT